MAVLLALVISKPLELKIFEKELNAQSSKLPQIEVGIHQTTDHITARKAEIDANLRQHKESLSGRWA